MALGPRTISAPSSAAWPGPPTEEEGQESVATRGDQGGEAVQDMFTLRHETPVNQALKPQ